MTSQPVTASFCCPACFRQRVQAVTDLSCLHFEHAAAQHPSRQLWSSQAGASLPLCHCYGHVAPLSSEPRLACAQAS